MTWRVLIVEDEPELQMVLRDNLEIEGYVVLSAESGELGVELALKERPDVVILDLTLPKMSGHAVCRTLRAKRLDTRIIMLTVHDTEADRIAGLDCGADDYVGKPFSLAELMARVRAQIRDRSPGQAAPPAVVRLGDVVVTLQDRKVRRGTTVLSLTTREFDLLQYFVEHQGETLSRERLQADVWGYEDSVVTRTVDNFVAKLRRHIEADPLQPRHLLTVHGSGYRLVP